MNIQEDQEDLRPGRAVRVPARMCPCSRGARAWCSIVSPNAHAMGGANIKREESAAKKMFASHASRDAVSFCCGPRASVTVDLRPIDLSELVCEQRSVVALDVYAMGGANTKREQSATTSTPAGHVSVPSGIVC